MPYHIQPMTQHDAEAIAYEWHYDGQYAFYDMEADPEDLTELLNPEDRKDKYFSVFLKTSLIGFFYFEKVNSETINLGLGMKPSLTGQGQGLAFIKAGLEFISDQQHPQTITLSVATFNQRAIKVYERAGFNPIKTFNQKTNGGEYEFLRMDYDLI